jgi:hypothetical protein
MLQRGLGHFVLGLADDLGALSEKATVSDSIKFKP